MVVSALQCLLEIAPIAGGSRDVCALIERFVGSMLLENAEMQEKRSQTMDFFDSESLSLLVAFGVKACTTEDAGGQAKAALDSILQLAADTLEEDKKVLDARTSGGEGTATEKDIALPSTLHVFVPHRDRGKPNKKKKPQSARKVPDRQLVNSVAEILIWTRTNLMSSNKAFAGCYERLLEAASAGISNDSKAKAKAALQTLQTIVRKERKKFNDFARTEGFMLSDLMQQDEKALQYRHIVKGKDGDLTKLTKLATKKGSTNILRMINARFASDPSKITRYESIRALVQAWSPPPSETAPMETDEKNGNDEIEKLEHEIKVARLKATIKHLRGAYKRTDRQVVLASLDSNVDSHTAALLVAAAMGKWEMECSTDGDVTMTDEKAASDTGCHLHLPGGTVHNVGSFQAVCDLLTSLVNSDPEIYPSMAQSDGGATIKAVVNVINKHLKANQTLLLFSSTDLKLPADCAETLLKQECSIHQHDVDDLQRRLEREGAKRGDITISLSWDTQDDLDLHVVLPNGEEIYYDHNFSGKKGKANLDVDMNASSPYSNSPVENVFVGDLDKKETAPLGKYKVIVQNFGYHARGSTQKTEIPWLVCISKDGKKEKFTGKCVGSGASSNVVACEFEYFGRTAPIEDKKEQASGAVSASVNITTSIGQTLEALTEAIKSVGQQEQLNEVRQLLVEEVGDEEETKEERPLVSAAYEVTNRDRNQVLIFNLPKRFHSVVNKVYGGGDLAEQCAETIAKRLVKDKIPISELKKCGYPGDVVETVKTKMKVVST